MGSSAPDKPSFLRPFSGNRFRRLTAGRILCASVFLISFLIYFLTAERGASWWDCPEYLTAALLLEIGHPPGNPFWMLTHRFLASFSSDPFVQVRIINVASGFFMAGAASLLCSLTLTLLGRLFPRDGGRRWRDLVAAGGAALCFSFSDSAWFSAVEAEVYAMSAFLTALTVWIAVRMALTSDIGRRRRYIVLIAYLTGLSIGVHQLNLLVVPVIFLIWRLSRPSPTPWRCVGSFLLGLLAVAAILVGLMPGWLTMAGYVELLFVNRLHLPYNSGLVAAALLSLIICWGLPFMAPPRRQGLRILLWCVPMVLTGYFSYGVIVIRAAAAPPMNQGDPSDPFRLRSYILREQYGGAPLFYGATPYSRPLMREVFKDSVWTYAEPVRVAEAPEWNRRVPGARLSRRAGLMTEADLRRADSLNRDGAERYLMTGYRYHLMTTPELDMFLPRIHDAGSLDDYALWAGADTLTMNSVMVSDALDSLGNPVGRRDREGVRHLRQAWRPTYWQNLKMMLGYQFGYMYGRYLLWNFSGRQNDVSSGGEIEHGNFLTGVPPLDDAMLGPQKLLPPELGSDNAGRNRYFMIPLLFGLAGVVFLCLRGRKRFTGDKPADAVTVCSLYGRRGIFWCSLLLFLMTGLAIVFYLNQTPGEPRERDYSFIGSFWVFAFWIGIGMRWALGVGKRIGLTASSVALVLLAPALMLAENYDDHDRSRRSPVYGHAVLTLQSLPQDAILFVNGDNDTFPFWYASHVLGVRRDVTVVNLSYLSTPWYVASLRRQAWEGKGLEMTMPHGLPDYGAYALTGVPVSRSDTAEAVPALRALYADERAIPVLPERLLRMADGGVLDLSAENTGMDRPYLSLRQLAIIDILATNAASSAPRPVIWHSSALWKDYTGFYPLTRKVLFGRIYDSACSNPAASAAGLEQAARATTDWMEKEWGDPAVDPCNLYLDEVTVQKLRRLRRDLLLTARVLSDSGRPRAAAALTRQVLRRIPVWKIRMREVRTADSLLCESRLAVGILRDGAAATDSLDWTEKENLLKEAELTLREDSLNRAAFHRYRHALTPAQRRALSPVSRSR